MPLGTIRTVYTVAKDMDLLQRFYGGALELPLAFRDRDNWSQFKAGQVSFTKGQYAQALQRLEAALSVDPSNKDLQSMVLEMQSIAGSMPAKRFPCFTTVKVARPYSLTSAGSTTPPVHS